MVKDILVWKNPRDLTLSPNNVRKKISDNILKNQGVFDKEFWESLEAEEIADLATSVSEVGVRNPIVINQRDEVVAGQRRWLAALKANLDKVPCVQRRYENDIEEICDSFAENQKEEVRREDMYHSLKKLRDHGLSIRQISAKTSIPKSTVHDILAYGDRWGGLPTPIPETYIDKWERMNRIQQRAAKKLLKQIGNPSVKETKEIIDYCYDNPVDKVQRKVLGIKDEMLSFKCPNSDSDKPQPVTIVNLAIPSHIIQKLERTLKKSKLDLRQFIIFLINKFIEEMKEG